MPFTFIFPPASAALLKSAEMTDADKIHIAHMLEHRPRDTRQHRLKEFIRERRVKLLVRYLPVARRMGMKRSLLMFRRDVVDARPSQRDV